MPTQRMRPVLLSALIFCAAPAEAYEFKGVQVGGPKTYRSVEVERALAARGMGSGTGGLRWFRCELTKDGLYFCNGVSSIKSLKVQSDALISKDGIVESINLYFKPADFKQVEDWTKQTYGEPSDTRTEPFNGESDSSFQNIDHIWLDDQGRFIRLTRYANRVSDARLDFGVATGVPTSKSREDEADEKPSTQ